MDAFEVPVSVALTSRRIAVAKAWSVAMHPHLQLWCICHTYLGGKWQMQANPRTPQDITHTAERFSARVAAQSRLHGLVPDHGPRLQHSLMMTQKRAYPPHAWRVYSWILRTLGSCSEAPLELVITGRNVMGASHRFWSLPRFGKVFKWLYFCAEVLSALQVGSSKLSTASQSLCAHLLKLRHNTNSHGEQHGKQAAAVSGWAECSQASSQAPAARCCLAQSAAGTACFGLPR